MGRRRVDEIGARGWEERLRAENELMTEIHKLL